MRAAGKFAFREKTWSIVPRAAEPHRDVRRGATEPMELAKQKERAEALRGRLDELRGYL